MSRRFVIVANPVSGKREALQKLERVKARFEEEKVPYQAFITSPTSNAKAIVHEQVEKGCTDILVIGGDGTINEAVNGLYRHIPVPVSIIPAGTGNDFVKNYPIGKTLEDQIQAAIHGQIKQVDLAVCNRRFFVNCVGVGFDGQVIRDMMFEGKWLQGYWAYLLTSLKLLASYQAEELSFSVDGKLHAVSDLLLLTVANGTTIGGGFRIAPQARIDDGLLDICMVEDAGIWSRIRMLKDATQGVHGHYPEVHFFQATKIDIESHPILVAHIDGEYFGHPPFSFSMHEHKLPLRI